MPACLSAPLPHYAFRDRGERGREREREREREEKRERERAGENGLRLAVPCLAGSPYFSVVRVPPLGIVPMTVLHHGNPDEQRERER